MRLCRVSRLDDGELVARSDLSERGLLTGEAQIRRSTPRRGVQAERAFSLPADDD